MFTVIIPANNEAGWISACLAALLASDDAAPPDVEIIVSANACVDATVALAEAQAPAAAARGWTLRVIDRPEPGKPGALNAADAAARRPARVYLDSDVTVSPGLLGQLSGILARPAPVYSSGRLVITAEGAISRGYARLWQRLPFMARSLPGCGIFAVNAAGRARWGDFPAIIADDLFVRLHFAPEERIGAAASYRWPIAEGFGALIRVRRRQNAGVAQLGRLYPELLPNEDKPGLGMAHVVRLALADPMGFATYGAVTLAVAMRPGGTVWIRGR